MTASYWTMAPMGRSTFGKVIVCICSSACVVKSHFFNHCLTLLTHREWSPFRWEESCHEGGRWVYYRNELSQDENAGLFHFHLCAQNYDLFFQSSTFLYVLRWKFSLRVVNLSSSNSSSRAGVKHTNISDVCRNGSSFCIITRQWCSLPVKTLCY